MLIALKIDLDDSRTIALINIKYDRYRRCGNFFLGDGYSCVRKSFRRKHFSQYAGCGACFYRIINRLFRDADAFLTKFFQDVRFLEGLGTFELKVAYDRQFANLKDHIDAAADAILGQNAGCCLIKKV